MYLTYLYDKGYDGIDLQRVYFRNTDDGQRPATATGTTGEIETLNFGATVRGPGKIYSAIHAEHLSDDWQFRISSTTSDGKQVPAKVVQAASDPVAVFPIVAQSQTVSVSAVDSDGRTRAQGSKTFNRRAAQLMSYANRLSHNAEASTIHNCDKAMLLGDSHVVVDALINNLDATDIIHGHVSVPLVGDESAKDYVDIIALDGQGNQISMGDWICMGEELDTDPALPGLRVRKISYSLHIPQVDTFIVWVKFPDSDRQDSFLCSLPLQTHLMHHQWATQTEPACAAGDYDKWFRTRQRASANELEIQQRTVFDVQPKYSIIVPLYKTPIQFLHAMADSVMKQTYRNWELLLVNASPEVADLNQAVDKLCAKDHRIQHVTLERTRASH